LNQSLKDKINKTGIAKNHAIPAYFCWLGNLWELLISLTHFNVMEPLRIEGVIGKIKKINVEGYLTP